ncbi:hypothetical protein A5781_24140 [Mycobacterium sp. 852002-30065_SCH5024008]|nr:hypothetical protein A5758_21160 [Mycobacterium sp. 852014-50255_SCH5639931]OBB89846.1 hypothetical protein A5781_24140 [Mycobacterium sp. 852002-30065_SCH5024008]
MVGRLTVSRRMAENRAVRATATRLAVSQTNNDQTVAVDAGMEMRIHPAAAGMGTRMMAMGRHMRMTSLIPPPETRSPQTG